MRTVFEPALRNAHCHFSSRGLESRFYRAPGGDTIGLERCGVTLSVRLERSRQAIVLSVDGKAMKEFIYDVASGSVSGICKVASNVDVVVSLARARWLCRVLETLAGDEQPTSLAVVSARAARPHRRRTRLRDS
jgi:hypothetical protein